MTSSCVAQNFQRGAIWPHAFPLTWGSSSCMRVTELAVLLVPCLLSAGQVVLLEQSTVYAVFTVAVLAYTLVTCATARVPKHYTGTLRGHASANESFATTSACLIPLAAVSLALSMDSHFQAAALIFSSGSAVAQVTMLRNTPILVVSGVLMVACFHGFGPSELNLPGLLVGASTAVCLQAFAVALANCALNTFTYAEANLMACCLVFGLAYAILGRPASRDAALIQSALLACVLLAVIVAPTATSIKKSEPFGHSDQVGKLLAKDYSNGSARLGFTLSLLCTVSVVYAFAYSIALRPYGAEPVAAVFRYVGGNARSSWRCALLLYWSVLLAVCLCVFSPQYLAARTTKRTIARKAYHGLSVLLFLPGIAVDAPFTAFSMAVALAVLILAETVRVAQVLPFATIALENFTNALRDDRDGGPVVLTHLYLLAGNAIPVWLTVLLQNPVENDNGVDVATGGVAIVSGVLALGVLDTAASVVGSLYGRRRWPGTKKTVEGTVAATVVTAVVAMVWLWANDKQTLKEGSVASVLCFVRVFFVAMHAALFEASTQQIDNLVLPLCMYTMCHLTGLG